MSVAGGQAANAATDLTVRRDERRAAGVACGAHALHDGFTDVIFVLLPVWQREFGLGYAEVGMLRWWPERRARAFSIFYTGSIGAGALAPPLFGIVGDFLGVTAALIVVACVVLLTLPLALILKLVLPARIP